MRVFVYRNLHKKCLSVRLVATGLVIAHVDIIYLTNCTLKVSQAGRNRVLRDRRKNVHAGVEGEWDPSEPIPPVLELTPLTYNPYVGPSFISMPSMTPYSSCPWAVITANRVFARDPVA